MLAFSVRLGRMRIESWWITDVGKKRDHNEDSLLCLPDIDPYVVADGMGGHRAGDIASRLAVETIESVLRAALPLTLEPPKRGTMLFFSPPSDPVVQLLTQAVQAASSAILDAVEKEPELSGMGTTVSGLFFVGEQATFMHIGDSRIYQLRQGELRRITTDHSFVQEQVDAGLLSQAEAQQSRFKNIITRSVGFERGIEVDSAPLSGLPGDLFLLCSDGLSNVVEESELREILQNKDPETALRFFVNLANSRGGDDNVSAILLKIS